VNYYPFHLGDYAAHTGHLSPLEDLAYRRMIDLYYLRECPLPADWREVARLIRLRDNGTEIEAVLSEFFTLSDSGWSHVRCDAEITKMQDKQTKARASAEASVRARSTNAQRTLNERSTNAELPTPTPTPTPTPEKKERETRNPRPQPVGCLSVDDLVAEGVDTQVAKDWLQVRKDKGAKTLTQTAWDGVKAESIKAGLSVSDAVRVAAQNSWQGFKASWLDNSTPQSRPGFVMAEKPLSPAERQMYAASPTRCNDRVKRMMAAELGNNAPHIVDNIIEMDQGYGAPTLLG